MTTSVHLLAEFYVNLILKQLFLIQTNLWAKIKVLLKTKLCGFFSIHGDILIKMTFDFPYLVQVWVCWSSCWACICGLSVKSTCVVLLLVCPVIFSFSLLLLQKSINFSCKNTKLIVLPMGYCISSQPLLEVKTKHELGCILIKCYCTGNKCKIDLLQWDRNRNDTFAYRKIFTISNKNVCLNDIYQSSCKPYQKPQFLPLGEWKLSGGVGGKPFLCVDGEHIALSVQNCFLLGKFP